MLKDILDRQERMRAAGTLLGAKRTGTTAPLWNNRKAAKTRPACAHLGEPTGETVECKTCGGRVQLKLLECSVHGTCTAGKKVEGIACCRDCTDYRNPTLTMCLAFPAAPGEPYDIVGSESTTFADGRWETSIDYECRKCGPKTIHFRIDRELRMQWRFGGEWSEPAAPSCIDGLAPINASYQWRGTDMVLWASGPP